MNFPFVKLSIFAFLLHNEDIKRRSDETMRKFASGFVTGTLAAAAVVAGVVMGVKKKVIDPIEEKESKIDENLKKARTKLIAR